MTGSRRSRLPVRVGLTLFAALALAVAIMPGRIDTTSAAWTDPEVASGTFTAGTVSPATGLSCAPRANGRVRFAWTPSVGGLNRTGYRWTLTGGIAASGTRPAGATLVNVPYFTAGTATFSLYAVSGTWSSVAVTGTVYITSNSAAGACSVP